MTISAKVVADSETVADGELVRLATIEARYPRFIHAEVMTHRMFSRNASSSRAIPVKRAIRMIREDPAMPIHWGANQPGMQADQELGSIAKAVMRFLWLAGMWIMTTIALLADRLGAHKQIVNRLCEPWAHITVVISATEWANFFMLRRHRDAQPEIRALADAIYLAMKDSDPSYLVEGEWHLPYIDENYDLREARVYAAQIGNRDSNGSRVEAIEILKMMSAARCARVSYLTHDGKNPTVEQDVALYKRLAGSSPIHASPLEHQATPTGSTAFVANFRGWKQFRKEHGNENVPGGLRAVA